MPVVIFGCAEDQAIAAVEDCECFLQRQEGEGCVDVGGVSGGGYGEVVGLQGGWLDEEAERGWRFVEDVGGDEVEPWF